MFCKQDPHLSLSKSRRITIFIIGVIESMLFCGAVFGWPQLVFLLKNDGIYSNLCTDNAFGQSVSLHNMSIHNNNKFIEDQDLKKHTSNLLESENTFTTEHFNHEYENKTTENIPVSVSQSNARCLKEDLNELKLDSQNKKIGGCIAQDERYALIYSILIGCYSMPGVLIGYLLHVAGLRVTRVLACTMIIISFLCLGAATKESPNWLFPAMILMAIGGNQLRMCGMQFGDLFPKYRSTAITVLTGVYASSASLFLVYKFLAAVGVTRRYVSWGFAGIALILLLTSFIMPVHHIPVSGAPVLDRRKTHKVAPLSSSLWSVSSLLHQYWFFISLFGMNSYQQSYNVWVTASSCTEAEVSLFSSMFSYSNLFTIFFAPVGGYFTDYMIKRARNQATTEIEFQLKEIQANFLPLLVTSMAVTGMYLGLFFFHPVSIYMSLTSMMIARPCIVAISTAFVRIRFPVEHFNRLLGIYGTVTSALLLVLLYPYFRWSQYMYYAAHGFGLFMMLLSYSYPLHLLFKPNIKQVLRERMKIINNGNQEPIT